MEPKHSNDGAPNGEAPETVAGDAPPPVLTTVEPAEPVAPADEIDPAAPYGRKADGTPKAKPGRKSASEQTGEEERATHARVESVTQAPPRVKRAPTIAPAPSVAVDYQALGRTAANLWFNVGQIPFGDDWAPNTAQGEHEIVAGGFRDYFKAKNVTEIDPTVSLCLILGSYALARVNKPTVKERIKGAWLWVKTKIKR